MRAHLPSLPVGKYFFEFEIPLDLAALWRYMGQMYNLDAFTQSCPADQDIINHYKQQMHVKMSRHEELEAPTYTNSTPSEGKTLVYKYNSYHLH